MDFTKSVERLMKDAVDFHFHAGPDPYHPRRVDVLDLALQAKEAGMKAIVAKCHQFGTAPLAYLVNKLVPGFTLIGSLTLNREVGGLNPEVVEVSAKYGAKVIWMPTSSSVVEKGKTNSGRAISLIDGEKKLLPPVVSILEIIKENDMVLGTGHISIPEINVVTTEAKRMGIKVTITHPLNSSFGSMLTMDQQKELVAEGRVYIEHCFVSCMPVLGGMSPRIIVDHIKAVGEEHCILSTDFGQAIHPNLPEGFGMMIANMIQFGLSEKELEILVKVNPSKLLGLS
jgi:hypothetical protein